MGKVSLRPYLNQIFPEEIPGFSLIYQLVCLHLQCQSS
nr:MAG TPA: hypothetical protein [Caudoviricetes sp.]